MTNNAPCKHGCGASVGPDEPTCPSCGGPDPFPETGPQGKAGRIEKGCLIVMIVGGLLTSIGLIVTKLIIG